MMTIGAARMERWLVAGVAAALLCGALPEAASAAGRSPADVWRRIRKLRMRYVVKALGLEGEKAAKFKSILRAFNGKRSKQWTKLRRARREVRRLIKEHGPDAQSAQAALDTITASRLAIAKLKHDEFQELRKILSPAQQALYLKAKRKFRRRIQKLLRRIRRKRKKSKR